MLTRRNLLASGAALGTFARAGVAVAAPEAKGGTLNSLLWPEPPGLVMGIWLNTPTLLPATKIYEGLLTYDFHMNPMPSLAQSFEVAPDGLTYTFHLRPDVLWHDGKPLSADDALFTFNEFLIAVHPRSRPIFLRTKAHKADDHTIVFTLKEPFAALIHSFDAIGAPLVPAHLYKGTDYRKNPHNLHPIGTGPFMFEEWRHGQYIHLRRNDHYWREGMPHLAEIYYRLVPDSASRALALQMGEVQLATQDDLDLPDVRRLQSDPHLITEYKGSEWAAPITWLDLNNRRKPFNDRRFRQAIMYALNRQFIRNTIFFGFARPATGPIHSSSPYYNPNVKKYPYDPAKAKALLDAMGLKPGNDGVRVQVTLLGLPYGSVWNRLSEYVKEALKQVGIQVTLQSLDVAGWGQRIANWEYDMAVTYMTTLSDPTLGVARSYISSNIKKGILFNNESGYSNPKVDALFAEAAGAIDDAKRKKLFFEVQNILVEDVPIAWLVELVWSTIHSRKLEHVIVDGFGPNGTFAETTLAA